MSVSTFHIAVSIETALHGGQERQVAVQLPGDIAVSIETALHGGVMDRDAVDTDPAQIAVSIETALHGGPGMPPRAGVRCCANRGLHRDRPSLRRGSGAGHGVRVNHGIAVSIETALHGGRQTPEGRSAYCTGPIAVSIETALHGGTSNTTADFQLDLSIAVSIETALHGGS